MATSTSYRQEILIPKAQICEFDSMPLPSAIINKITVHDENITITNVTNQDLGGRISEVVVNVEWRRPGVNVNVYDVRVTERQSSDDESDFGEEFTLQRFEVCVSFFLFTYFTPRDKFGQKAAHAVSDPYLNFLLSGRKIL